MLFHNFLQRSSLSNNPKVQKHHFFFWHPYCRTLMDGTLPQKILSSGRKWLSSLSHMARHLLLEVLLLLIMKRYCLLTSFWSFCRYCIMKKHCILTSFWSFQSFFWSWTVSLRFMSPCLICKHDPRVDEHNADLAIFKLWSCWCDFRVLESSGFEILDASIASFAFRDLKCGSHP